MRQVVLLRCKIIERLLGLILLASVIGIPSATQAEPLVDQAFTGSSGTLVLYVIGAGASHVGQTFTAGKTGILSGVSIDVDAHDSNPNAQLNVETYSG